MGEFGRDLRRVEDVALVQGAAHYAADLKFPDALHGYVLRSPVASAAIRSIDVSAARASDGVLAVLTGADVAADGLGRLTSATAPPGPDGAPVEDTALPILAQGDVRFAGQPVALVVARSLAEAKDAAELIDVDYDMRSAAVGVEAALGKDAPVVSSAYPGNVVYRTEVGDRRAAEAAFANAAHVTRVKLDNNRVVVNAMEPRAAIAEYSQTDGRSIIHTQTQGAHLILEEIAAHVFNLPSETFRVVTPQVGGGFGMKGVAYPEQALVTWASRRLKRTVRWVSERGEAFLSDAHGRAIFCEGELALDADGRFLALRARLLSDLGGYVFAMGAYIAQIASHMLTGCYRTPIVYAEVLGVLTNTVPTSAYRGAGRPEAAFLVERLVDKAARETGIPPDELRRKNFIRAADMPYVTPSGPTYDVGDFAAVMAAGLKRADWTGFAGRLKESKARGMLRGLGLGYYIEQCGGGMVENVKLEFPGNGRVVAYMGTQDNGQGHTTSYKQILADQFEIAMDLIDIRQGDTDASPFGLTGGSRSIPVGGGALVGVAGKVKEKGCKIAANVLEAAVEDIEFKDGGFVIAGTDRGIGLFDLAEAARDSANLPEGVEGNLDEVHAFADAPMTFPNGCHVAEVEIDPETGKTVIARYTAVDDFGNILNPLLVDGQNHGGIAQGIGQAVLEHTVFDEDGQLKSGSFMDYAIPRADDLPLFDLATENIPATGNPLGLKGVAEAGTIGAPPAIVNAIIDALHRHNGTLDIEMPTTPLSVWQAIRRR